MPRKHKPAQRTHAARSHSQYDASYKRLFSEPLMVRSLLQDLIAEDFVAELDLDTLERLPGEHVARGGQKRFSDIVWKVQRKGRSDAPCYIAILLEFQSTPDRLMALRLLTYVALLLEELAKDKAVQQSGQLPPVCCPSCSTTAVHRGRARRTWQSFLRPCQRACAPSIPK